MPYPREYQRASDDFAAFLDDLKRVAMYGSPHPAYTTTQAVFQVFRRRISLQDGVRFAAALPAGLRALFVADWDPDEPRVSFDTVDRMTAEARQLRVGHNFVDDDSIAQVSRVLWRHVDPSRLASVLSAMPDDARAFWSAGVPRETGFSVAFTVHDAAAGTAFDDAFIAQAIEGRGLRCGGGAGPNWSVFVTKAGYGSATEADRAAVGAWLEARPEVRGIAIGALQDVDQFERR